MGFGIRLPLHALRRDVTALPEPPIKDGIRVQDIVDAVQCELARVYDAPKGSYLENWLARVTLELKVTDACNSRRPYSNHLPCL